MIGFEVADGVLVGSGLYRAGSWSRHKEEGTGLVRVGNLDERLMRGDAVYLPQGAKSYLGATGGAEMRLFWVSAGEES